MSYETIAPAPGSSLRIAVVGFGSIGRALTAWVLADKIPSVELIGVVEQKPLVAAPPGLQRITLQEALSNSDIIVECAGADFVRQSACAVLERGIDLVVCSLGAYADPALRAELSAAGPGRVAHPTGAIGGLDLLQAAARVDRFERVTLTTTKPPRSLLREWMDVGMRDKLLHADTSEEIFRGDVRDACELFPSSINVAAAVAFAVDDFDAVEVVIRSDPAATVNRHEIDARAPFGRYQFTFDNKPSPENPRTSTIVAASVLHALDQLVQARLPLALRPGR
jgi:aspartate dehydrogenase